MELFRLNAYSVVPQRGVENPSEPEGGAVRITAELRSLTDESLASTKLENSTLVDFQVDTTTRTNATRDSILDYAFGKRAAAEKAAIFLARRLSRGMDHRSKPCLFVLAARRDDASRAVTLWTFPRDEAFRLNRGRGGPSIEVLTDIFSQTSALRKAAHFQGKQLRNAFLSGRALDSQAQDALRDVADFWISRFLECRFGIAGDAGTRVLAKTILKAYQSLESPEDKESLYSAVMAVRNTPNPRLSLRTFGNRYLSGTAKEVFVKSAPNAESLSSLFDFQRTVFDSTVQFRIFQLDTGVYVSSPLGEVGKSVQISDGKRRRLSCLGDIVDERLRTQHA